MGLQMLLVSNLLLSILLYVTYKKRDANEAIWMLIMGLAVPIIGVSFALIFLGVSQLKAKDNILNHVHGDERRGPIYYAPKDIVPIHEALVLNDRQVKKNVLIEALKMDKTKYIGALSQAAENEDSEASHYGAVAIMDIKDYFNNELKKYEKHLEELSEDEEGLLEYSSLLEKSIDSGLNEKSRLKLLQDKQQKILHLLMEKKWARPHHYESLMQLYLKLGEKEKAYKVCQDFMKRYPEREEAYFAYMDFYYEMQDQEGFCKWLEQLKASSVVLSQDGLKRIRFWLEERE